MDFKNIRIGQIFIYNGEYVNAHYSINHCQFRRCSCHYKVLQRIETEKGYSIGFSIHNGFIANPYLSNQYYDHSSIPDYDFLTAGTHDGIWNHHGGRDCLGLVFEFVYASGSNESEEMGYGIQSRNKTKCIRKNHRQIR